MPDQTNGGRPQFAARANRPEGAFNLDDFPLLVVSERQYGDRLVRTEDGRATVAEIAEALDGGESPSAIASRLGTTAAHVADAWAYSHAGKPLDAADHAPGGA